MGLPPSHPERRWRFDGTITLGNLITAIPLIIGLIGWGFRMESRADRQEFRIDQVEVRMDRDSAAAAVSQSEIKQSLRDMAAKLDRLIERITPVR